MANPWIKLPWSMLDFVNFNSFSIAVDVRVSTGARRFFVIYFTAINTTDLQRALSANRKCNSCGVSIDGMPSSYYLCTVCATEHVRDNKSGHCLHCGNKVGLDKDGKKYGLCFECYFKKCVVCGDRTGNPGHDKCKRCYARSFRK